MASSSFAAPRRLRPLGSSLGLRLCLSASGSVAARRSPCNSALTPWAASSSRLLSFSAHSSAAAAAAAARRGGIQVAIDGPSASGKSTTARLLAARLGYAHIDTGAMYRAMALACLKRGLNLSDTASYAAVKDAVFETASRASLELVPTPDSAASAASMEAEGRDSAPPRVQHRLFLDGVDVSEEIRLNHVSIAVPLIAKDPNVRSLLLRRQRELGRNGGVVMEGRDIGSVVFPEAELKIFLDAPVSERALRRFNELRQRSPASPVDLKDIEREIEERDHQDRTRATSPLVKASDAIEVSTFGLTVEQVVDKIEALARQRIRIASAPTAPSK